MASLNQLNYEVQRAMVKREAEGTHVIPILLSNAANWQNVKLGDVQLGNLQPLPGNGHFVTGRFWKNQNEAFVTIVEEFEELVKNLDSES